MNGLSQPNSLAPEIPKTRVEEEKEKEEEPSEEQKEVTAVSSIQHRARSNPLAAVYQDIPNEEPPAYEFTQNVPELYSLEMDILRLTAQYTAINGRKVSLFHISLIFFIVLGRNPKLSKLESSVRLFEANAHSARYFPRIHRSIHKNHPLRRVHQGPSPQHLQASRSRAAHFGPPHGVPPPARRGGAKAEAGDGGDAGRPGDRLGRFCGGSDHHPRRRFSRQTAPRPALHRRTSSFPFLS